jgi:hypothetical protein
MRRLALVALVALTACHTSRKSDGDGTGSTSSGSAAAPSAAAAGGSGSSTTTTAPSGAQPQRSAADAARFNDVERVLAEAMASAKQAKTLKEACSGVPALDEKIGALQQVTPPPGTEQAFSTLRNALAMEIDVMGDQRCSDSSGADADTIRDELESLRRDFTKLQQIGAKP